MVREGGRAYLLGHTVGGTGVEGGGLALGHFLHLAVQLGGGGLVQAGGLLQAAGTDGIQETEGADAEWREGGEGGRREVRMCFEGEERRKVTPRKERKQSACRTRREEGREGGGEGGRERTRRHQPCTRTSGKRP